MLYEENEINLCTWVVAFYSKSSLLAIDPFSVFWGDQNDNEAIRYCSC